MKSHRSSTRRSVLRSLVLAAVVAVAGMPEPASAASRRAPFQPTRHGFNFDNTFQNNVVGGIDFRTGGLCGGMVYAAMDYFNARMKIPRQSWKPANRTRLQSYIYNRQVHSLSAPNLARWASMGMNPGGGRRNRALFHQALTQQFAKIRASIDRGKPMAMGVHGVASRTHQIMAIGYRDDGEANRSIVVYDPNFNDEIITMKANNAKQWFEYVGKSDSKDPHRYRWRTFFADDQYKAKRPPALRDPSYPDDGKAYEFLVHFDIGDDDLRGGRDNVGLRVHTSSGKQDFPNINLGARWLENYKESARVRVRRPIPLNTIRSFELYTNFGGGTGGDNFDTTSIIVDHIKGSTPHRLAIRRGLFRFTGGRKSLRLPYGRPAPTATAGQVTKLEVIIGTGDDDLRGNEDNVNATVLRRGGRSQVVRSINERRPWGNGSSKTVWIHLATPANRADLQGLRLQHTSRGGFGADDWTLNSVKVIAHMQGGTKAVLYNQSRHRLYHFEGRRRVFTANW